MGIFAVFNDEGFVRGLYHVDEASDAPAGSIEISKAAWADLSENQAYRRWNGSRVVNYTPPAITPKLSTAKADIWRRATDAEAVKIAAGLDALPLRKRRIYDDATYLDHSDPLFDELVTGFIQAFGEARTSVLLAASE